MSAPPQDAPASSESGRIRHARLIWQHRWNDHLLSFRIERPAEYVFVPGQFARIGLAVTDAEPLWRAYSIVSAPHEPFLEFFLVVVPEGAFSSRVAALGVGDALLLESPAQGFLTLDRFADGRDLWLVATGTGLAPFIAMLRDGGVWSRFENIVLVYSARALSDLGYLDELAAMTSRPGGARLHVVKTLTRDPQTGDVLHGRITQLLENGELERAADLPLDLERSRILLCGNPDMVESMRGLLKARGFAMNRRLKPGHIIVENYW